MVRNPQPPAARCGLGKIVLQIVKPRQQAAVMNVVFELQPGFAHGDGRRPVIVGKIRDQNVPSAVEIGIQRHRATKRGFGWALLPCRGFEQAENC
ncbi:MAG: hypothetical protein KGS61_07570 [Verrucomicrobia bacterium]|nr:hypothetical protein [Verrucomicrobiota bacterium]